MSAVARCPTWSSSRCPRLHRRLQLPQPPAVLARPSATVPRATPASRKCSKRNRGNHRYRKRKNKADNSVTPNAAAAIKKIPWYGVIHIAGHANLYPSNRHLLLHGINKPEKQTARAISHECTGSLSFSMPHGRELVGRVGLRGGSRRDLRGSAMYSQPGGVQTMARAGGFYRRLFDDRGDGGAGGHRNARICAEMATGYGGAAY